MTIEERVFWRGGRATVWVGRDDDGALVFSGQDLDHLGGYEYWITVDPARFADLRSALGGDADADVVDLVCSRVADIMPGGERRWLDAQGIDYAFSSH